VQFHAAAFEHTVLCELKHGWLCGLAAQKTAKCLNQREELCLAERTLVQRAFRLSPCKHTLFKCSCTFSNHLYTIHFSTWSRPKRLYVVNKGFCVPITFCNWSCTVAG
jgi:hypothetical protein